MNRVFVYGSLMKGFGNHGLVEGSEFIGPAKTHPEFTMISYGFFPACLTEGDTAISGEVYDVTDGVLARLDRLEGHPTWYRRIRCNTDKGEAWMYTMNPETLENARKVEKIESGNWRLDQQRK